MTIVSPSAILIKRWWRLLFIFLTPIILLPLPLLINTIQVRCAYIVLLLIAYWVSDAIPYAVTSLFPLALFPMAGIIPGDQVSLNYFRDITTLRFGSMALAYAMEHVHLHRRLALLVLRYVGASIVWSMAGLMGLTAFLSMWINNSAAANIMIPTAIAIVNELQNDHQTMKQTAVSNENDNHESSTDNVSINSTTAFANKPYSNEQAMELLPILKNMVITSTIPANDATSSGSQPERSLKVPVNPSSADQVDYDGLKTGFLIAVAYSASIGGMMTLVGTSPNMFLKGFADQYYASGNIIFHISFANFLLFGLPIGLTLLVLCWLWLQILYNRRGFFRCKKSSANEVGFRANLQSILRQQYEELGPVNWQEYTIAVLFIVVVVLWLTRDFSSYPGWEIWFRKNYVTDGTTAIFIGCLPLLLPNKNPFSDGWEYHPILEWNQLSREFPWGVLMLQGACLAIADGFQASNLSTSIAEFFQFIVGASETVIILVVIIISAVFTEFTDNLACATILFPILDSLAKTANIHPGRLILPSCMAVSLGYMLPIATPPNAMIFVSGNMKTTDLMKAGLGMKLIGIMVIFLASLFLISPIFHIPDIISVSNTTVMSNVTNS